MKTERTVLVGDTVRINSHILYSFDHTPAYRRVVGTTGRVIGIERLLGDGNYAQLDVRTDPHIAEFLFAELDVIG